MSAVQRISDRHALLDLVALDREGKPVLMVGAEGQEADPIILASYLEVFGAIRRDIPFAVLASPKNLILYRKDPSRAFEAIAEIPTRKILEFYSSNFEDGLTFKEFLVGMIDAWLRDLMGHWKSPTPPASETMKALGLADRLEGGSLKRRVRLACLPVRRDQLPFELRDGEEYWSTHDAQRSSQHSSPDPA